MFHASEWEFRYRFWIIGACYWIGFGLGWQVDHTNAAVALAGWVASFRHTTLTDAQVLPYFWAGALLAVLGAALRTWGTGYLRSSVMVDGRLHASRLVSDGPYRHLRNPLYLGGILLAFGFAPMATRIGALLLIIGKTWFSLRLIGREERELLAAQGASYADYCRAVPRLIPSLLPRLPAAGGSYSLRDGLLGEAFFWCMAASLVVFAATLKIQWFFVTLGSAFAVYFLCYYFIRRRAEIPSGGSAA